MLKQIRAAKRDRILEEATSQFVDRGFTATTLDDIAHRLGVTKPFIYNHFRSKIDILPAICLPVAKLSLAVVTKAAKSEGTAAQRLRLLASEFTRVILENKAPITIYFRETNSLSEKTRLEMDAMRKKIDRAVGKLLQEGSVTGEFDIADTRVFALAIVGMITWTHTWHRSEGRLSNNDICEHMAGLTLRLAGASQEIAPARNGHGHGNGTPLTEPSQL